MSFIPRKVASRIVWGSISALLLIEAWTFFSTNIRTLAEMHFYAGLSFFLLIALLIGGLNMRKR